MFIELSRRFDGDPGKINEYRDQIHNLIYAHTSGFHVFVPTRGALGELLDADWLSERELATLSAIKENYSSILGGATSAVVSVLAIVAGDPGVWERENQDIVVPISHFGNPDAVARFRLLVEDIETDGEYFKLLCRLLARECGFSTAFSFEVIHGGSSSVLIDKLI